MSDEICKLLKRVDEDARGTRCLTMAEVTLCLQELKRLTSVPSECTYTHAEMLANQAAALKEAAEAIADVPYAATTKEYVKAILALTTDQLVLDRHDAELLRKNERGFETQSEENRYNVANLAWKKAEDQIAELKAQTAAMLEKAARLVYEAYSRGTGQVKFAASESANNIRALIPTDYAAALEEYAQKRIRELK